MDGGVGRQRGTAVPPVHGGGLRWGVGSLCQPAPRGAGAVGETGISEGVTLENCGLVERVLDLGFKSPGLEL